MGIQEGLISLPLPVRLWPPQQILFKRPMWAVGVRLLSGTSWVRVPPLEPTTAQHGGASLVAESLPSKQELASSILVTPSNFWLAYRSPLLTELTVTGKMRVQLLPRAPLPWRSTIGSATGLYPVSSRLERDPGSNPGARTRVILLNGSVNDSYHLVRVRFSLWEQ